METQNSPGIDRFLKKKTKRVGNMMNALINDDVGLRS